MSLTAELQSFFTIKHLNYYSTVIETKDLLSNRYKTSVPEAEVNQILKSNDNKELLQFSKYCLLLFFLKRNNQNSHHLKAQIYNSFNIKEKTEMAHLLFISENESSLNKIIRLDPQESFLKASEAMNGFNFKTFILKQSLQNPENYLHLKNVYEKYPPVGLDGHVYWELPELLSTFVKNDFVFKNMQFFIDKKIEKSQAETSKSMWRNLSLHLKLKEKDETPKKANKI